MRDIRAETRREFRREIRRRYGDISAKTLEHLRWDMRYWFGRKSVHWYTHLYNSGSMISGDMTPMLYLLTTNQILEIKAHLPQIKIIIHLRDPVERVWSNLNMFRNRNTRKDDEDITLKKLRHALDWNIHSLPSYYDLIQKWQNVFGEKQILINYYDEIVTHPAQVLTRTVNFLGLQMQDYTGIQEDINVPVNVTEKTPMPDEIRHFLTLQFQDEVKKLSENTTTPYPAEWMGRYNHFLTSCENAFND
jgi:hypothetical protein